MTSSQSIRFRLTFLSTFVLMVLMFIFGLTVFWISKKQILEAVDLNLSDKIALIQANIEWDDDEFELELGEEHQGAVWENAAIKVIDHRKRTVYENPRQGGVFELPKTDLGQYQNQTQLAYHFNHQNELYRGLLYVKESHGHKVYVLATASLESALDTIEQFKKTLSVVGLSVTFVSSCALWFALGFLLRPLTRMAERAKKISAQALDQRLEVINPHDEIGQLATTLNHLLARLEESFERVSRFTGDASHELRTPLAGIRTSIEVAFQKDRSKEEYQSILSDILEEVHRLTALSESLLSLTRHQKVLGQDEMQGLEPNAIMQSVCDKMSILVEDQGKTIEWRKGESPQMFQGDPGLVEQILLNLIDNAIKYGGTNIELESRIKEKYVELIVHDNGKRLSEDQQIDIFNRFVKLDQSRQNDGSGFGLGLCLARNFAEIQGGRLEFDLSYASGNAFKISLPVSDK